MMMGLLARVPTMVTHLGFDIVISSFDCSICLTDIFRSPSIQAHVAQPRHSPSTSLNASRAFRKASIPEGMPQ